METSFAALGIAIVAVSGFTVTLWAASLVIGAIEMYLGRPRLKFLRSTIGGHGFAFSFNFNEEKEPAKYNYFKIRLFNPAGSPTQAEVCQSFDAQSNSFAKDLDMGEGLIRLLGASKFEDARVIVELTSLADGINFQYEMKGSTFKKKLQSAKTTVQDYESSESSAGEAPISVPTRSFIADTVAGKSAQPAIESNPAYAHLFAGAGSGGADVVAVEQFAITKVWIEPGCIVCDACEDIFPQVFEVTADSCIIRPDAPLNDGLKVMDAAEACPVEVIKFTKAS
ncbi:ferredoxin [Bacteriovoracaceae bacterium]|nr:ferredoxin [Bacteriovoracaceae bacterium]